MPDALRVIGSFAMTEPNALATWIASQAQRSMAAMEHAISATNLTRRRESFGQVIVPARGSVLASPVIADWNPEPDYFFHWLRDSAIVMRVVAALMQDGATEHERARWRRHFDDFVNFSLALSKLDGAELVMHGRYRQATRRGFRKFLRPDAEVRKLAGDILLGEPRFNPDGTIDVFRWSRPQYDGPALRALACLRYLAVGGPPSDMLAELLRLDLRFTVSHAGRRCIGPWEEPGQNTHHYYVALVQLGALVHGRAFADDADAWHAAEAKLRATLARHWSERHRVYTAMAPATGDHADDLIDAVQMLAVLEADLPDGPNSVLDSRVHETIDAIEDFFAREFPITGDGMRRRSAATRVTAISAAARGIRPHWPRLRSVTPARGGRDRTARLCWPAATRSWQRCGR
ncbi:MAG: glycoside hydrolase family 15 protein [Pseudolabrys sp.]